MRLDGHNLFVIFLRASPPGIHSTILSAPTLRQKAVRSQGRPPCAAVQQALIPRFIAYQKRRPHGRRFFAALRPYFVFNREGVPAKASAAAFVGRGGAAERARPAARGGARDAQLAPTKGRPSCAAVQQALIGRKFTTQKLKNPGKSVFSGVFLYPFRPIAADAVCTNFIKYDRPDLYASHS